MLHKSQFVEFLHDDQQEEESPSCSTPENAANSPPLSVDDDDDDDINLQLPKKRRGAHKKVVTVTIGGGDDPRSKAEIHPPKDSWSWRKYGQKPIKGSPYPRGYYRCSSSKGCPAKKQVERSFHDPNILLITYSGDHSHSQSTTTKLNHHIDHHSTATPVKPIPVTSNAASSSSNASDINVPSTLSQEETLMVAPDINNFSEMTGGELGWFPSSSDMGTTLLDNPALVGPASASDHWDDDVDVNIMLPFGEEDQSLFGDLGELPESSAVFRRGIMEKT